MRPPMLRAAVLLTSMFFVSCGGPAACKTTCDCDNSQPATSKCPGEWACGASGTCGYECRNLCDPNGVSTCRSDEECIGTFCTARKACK